MLKFKNAANLLPDFMILGAQRSGTTALFANLSQHPEVAPSNIKETHFFDEAAKYQQGLLFYRGFFPCGMNKIVRKLKRQKFITGEATPYYLFHPRVPARVRKMPGASKLRFLVLLRHPVERAYSHYWHQKRDGHETLSFEEAIDNEDQRIAADSQKLLQDSHCYSFNHQHYSYLSRGIYVSQLQRWFDLFPRENFLILKSEDFFSNAAGTYQIILNFLKLSEYKPDSFEKRPIENYPEMAEETRKRLLKYFKPHNELLEDLLGRNFNWD